MKGYHKSQWVTSDFCVQSVSWNFVYDPTFVADVHNWGVHVVIWMQLLKNLFSTSRERAYEIRNLDQILNTWSANGSDQSKTCVKWLKAHNKWWMQLSEYGSRLSSWVVVVTIEELFSDLVYSAFSPKIPKVLHRFPGWQCRIKFMWSEYILEQHHGLFFNFSSPLLWHNVCGCYSVRFSCSPKKRKKKKTNLWWKLQK